MRVGWSDRFNQVRIAVFSVVRRYGRQKRWTFYAAEANRSSIRIGFDVSEAATLSRPTLASSSLAGETEEGTTVNPHFSYSDLAAMLSSCTPTLTSHSWTLLPSPPDTVASSSCRRKPMAASRTARASPRRRAAGSVHTALTSQWRTFVMRSC